MTDEPHLCTTPLHQTHKELGGTMAAFGGWDMPLWYKTGAIREHLAVVQKAGLFDTSHMDAVFVQGEAARDFLDYAFTREMSGAQPGRCVYGAFLDDRGHCLDDGIIYPMDDERYMIVVNASMAEPIRNHLLTLPDASGLSITLPEPRLGKLDIQGPASVRILRRIVANADEVFARFPYFTFRVECDLNAPAVTLTSGVPILLSRTGYTGEVGFELFLPYDRVKETWDLILQAGAEDGVIPCGLAARDSLRAGAVLPLSHQDIGPWPFINHPWPFALPLGPDGAFTKKFHGSDALNPETAWHTLPFVGYDQRRVEPKDAVVLREGEEAGIVTTIVSDMAIGRVDGRVLSLASQGKAEDWTLKGLACGFVRVKNAFPAGTELVLKDNRREIRVEIATDIRPDRTARKALTNFM